MKHTTLLLALSASVCFAQFEQDTISYTTPQRDGSYITTTHKMPSANSTYTPMMESNARAAMEEFMPQRYNYDELDSRYPVREVVPRNMLPYGAQMKLEEQDLQIRGQQLQNKRQELDVIKDQKALALQESIVNDAAGALREIGNLNPQSDDFADQVAALYEKYPNAADDTAVVRAISVLESRNQRLQNAREIRERSQEARDDAQDYQARQLAAQIASDLGDEETYNNVISAESGVTALGYALQQQTKARQGSLVQALYDEYKSQNPGKEPDDAFWSKFYTDGKFNAMGAERALKEYGTQQKDKAKEEGELWSRLTTIEKTIDRLRSQLKDADAETEKQINARIKNYESAHRGIAKQLGLEFDQQEEQPVVGPQPMPTPASTQWTRSGIAISTAKTPQQATDLRNQATNALDAVIKSGATPRQIQEAKDEINKRLATAGVDAI